MAGTRCCDKRIRYKLRSFATCLCFLAKYFKKLYKMAKNYSVFSSQKIVVKGLKMLTLNVVRGKIEKTVDYG